MQSTLTMQYFSDRLQISLLILKEFKQINFCSPWNHQNYMGFLMLSGGIEIN